MVIWGKNVQSEFENSWGMQKIWNKNLIVSCVDDNWGGHSCACLQFSDKTLSPHIKRMWITDVFTTVRI
jgi:hypothetical protein